MHQNIKESFKLLKQIKNPAFEVDRLDLYNLSMLVGERDFQVLITDVSNHQVMLVENYLFTGMTPSMSSAEILAYIFEDHHLLMAGFWDSVSVAWKNNIYSFVPEALYSDTMLSGYLRVNGDYSPDKDIIFKNLHDHGHYYTVFAGDKEISEFINTTYPNTQVRHFHQSSVLIESLLDYDDDQSIKIVLFSDRHSMNIVIFTNGSFRFYNQFPIRKLEDQGRFIDMTIKELQIERGDYSVTFYGYTGTDTPQYEAIKQFMETLKTGTKPKNMMFNYVFDELLDHQYYDLYSVYLANNRL